MKRKMLPKGQHYTDIVQTYITMIESGKKIKDIAKELDTPEMTIRWRLHAVDYKILNSNRPRMQLAALSYAIGIPATYEKIPNLRRKELANARFILKRFYNAPRLRRKLPPLTDAELASKLDASLIEKTIEYYRNRNEET